MVPWSDRDRSVPVGEWIDARHTVCKWCQHDAGTWDDLQVHINREHPLAGSGKPGDPALRFCPECDEPLIGSTRGEGHDVLSCSACCGYERDAIVGQEPDDSIMQDASEKYWLSRWSNA